jgi:hypothetical protein
LPTGFLLPLSRKFLLLAVSPEHTVKNEPLGALPVIARNHTRALQNRFDQRTAPACCPGPVRFGRERRLRWFFVSYLQQ